MIHINGEFSYTENTWVTDIYNFVHPYYSELSVDTQGYLRFDNKFSINVSTYNCAFTLIYDSDSSTFSLGHGGYFAGSGSCIATLIVKENIFYLKMLRKNYSNEGAIIFLWIAQDNRDFVGVYGGYNTYQNLSVNSINLCDAETKNLGSYTLYPIANYPIIAPNLVYYNKHPLVNSLGDFLLIDNLHTCSTVPVYSNVCITSKNYTAIGTNALIMLE